MTKPAPSWLADFQARFGAAITAPLDRTSGTLRAKPSSYDPVLVASTSERRLAIYNRQYWFRLFEVLQSAYPLTMRLLGAWGFNGLASRFLEQAPPASWNVDDATNHFETFLGSIDAAPFVIEAARLDAAWLRVFRAPPVRAFRPTAEDAPRIPTARLVPSPALVIVREHFDLAPLRRRILQETAETKVDPPRALATSRAWAIVRRASGIAEIALEEREAELLDLLGERTVSDALAMLEASCTDEERAALPAQTQRWLARSVENDFWIGLGQSQTTQL
ncbi:MAG TPA: DNA-binding domain-containing protein [Polyangiaceae bacterium]